jgi:2-dehydro-3-deoxyphosphogluconate aldolase / (4S)-4-hydroxy-2-oxoglutarate aldolase
MNKIEMALRHRVIPVIALPDGEAADTLGAALLAAGLDVVEVLVRTPFAVSAIERLGRMPGLVVGAGTILSRDVAQRAIDAGASFLVTPGLSEQIASTARAANIPLLPGIATATELQRAIELEFDTVKFFPAATSGGPDAIKALAAPFADVRFVPTGGITASTARDYLGIPAVAAVGGSWMVPPALLAAGDIPAITRSVAESLTMSRTR